MARKTKKENRHEFTRQIHSTKRTNSRFANMTNWNEKEAKSINKVCCKDCRGYDNGCYLFIGRYHKPCEEFKWW